MVDTAAGSVFWLTDAPGFPRQPLPATCDTAVVGAGLAGVWLALELRRAGRNVVLLEAGSVAGEASGRHGGQLVASLPWNYATAVMRLGRDRARHWRALLELNHAWLDSELAECRSAVQYMRTGSLACARNGEERRQLESSARLLVEDGFQAEPWTADQMLKRLGVGPFHGALYQPEDGTLHPARLVWTLAQRFLDAGGVLREHTPVLSCGAHPGGWRLGMEDGALQCRTVVWCVGSALGRCLPGFAAVVETVTGQTLVTARERKVFALPMSSADGLLHWRQTEKGEVLLSGPGLQAPGDGPNGSGPEPDAGVEAALQEFCRNTFPKLAGVEFGPGWCTRTARSADGLPLVGPHPDHPGQYVLGGWNGNGPGQAIVFGRLLAGELLQERPDERLKDFRPARLLSPAPTT